MRLGQQEKQKIKFLMLKAQLSAAQNSNAERKRNFILRL